jgi:hypothetical protein
MKVSATAMPVARQNSRSAGARAARTTPLPARAIGLIALRMRSAALSSSRRAGSGLTGRRRGSGAASTLGGHDVLGQLEVRGAGFSDSATLNALRTTSGMISGLVTRAFHLVIGGRARRVDELVDSLCIRSRSAWPVRATSGARSRKASPMAVTRFIAPGPSVPRHTPRAR